MPSWKSKYRHEANIPGVSRERIGDDGTVIPGHSAPAGVDSYYPRASGNVRMDREELQRREMARRRLSLLREMDRLLDAVREPWEGK